MLLWVSRSSRLQTVGRGCSTALSVPQTQPQDVKSGFSLPRETATIVSKENPGLGCVGRGLGWAEPEPLDPALTRFAPWPRLPLWSFTLPSHLTSHLSMGLHRPAFSLSSQTPHPAPQRTLP